MKRFLPLTMLLELLLFIFVLNSCTHENGGQDENGGQNLIRDAVTDVDGNHYDAVRLGNQVWMQSNLRTTHFRDGSAISWDSTNAWSIDSYCCQPVYFKPTMQQIPMYDERTYGLYYNMWAVEDDRGLCPDGWHVPTDAEWTKLEEYVGSKSEYVYGDDPRNIAKALASKMGWLESSEPGTPGCKPKKNDATGFTAVPASWYVCTGGSCDDYQEGRQAYFWMFTKDYCYGIHGRILDCKDSMLIRRSVFLDGIAGLSVRCVKD